MRKVVVIGGGAAGLMAAYAAQNEGAEVTLLERNEKLGKKIYITGKGRCNLTNDCPPDEFLQNVVRGGKFLTGAVRAFPPEKMMEFCERFSLPVKIERGEQGISRLRPCERCHQNVGKSLPFCGSRHPFERICEGNRHFA